MRNIKKYLAPVLFVLPALMGVLGYIIEEYSILDSLYGSICLYFFSPIYEEINPLVELARWCAPLATASGIILAVQDIAVRFKKWTTSLHKDATIVYAASDDSYAQKLASSCKHGLLSETSDEIELRFYPDAKDHILLLPNDADNLAFYEDHKDELKDKNVYMKLEKTGSFLLKESNVHFFNINEIIASDFWKNENLTSFYKSQLKTSPLGNFVLNVAIVGFDDIGQKLLDYGILMNLYDENQKITYHIFGDSIVYKNLHTGLNLMNKDAIVYHKEAWYEKQDVLKNCNRIIITDHADTMLIESVLSICTDSEVYIFSPEGVSYSSLYKFHCLKEFGSMDDIFTEDEIKNETRLEAAKKLNHKYACIYGQAQDIETEWRKLDGFTKASNIASANYHSIRKEILQLKEEANIVVSKDELSRIEHVRWCRFHYLNQWHFGIPDNGKAKDANKRIHTCLLPYDDLSEEDQRKDYEAVELLLEQL